MPSAFLQQYTSHQAPAHTHANAFAVICGMPAHCLAALRKERDLLKRSQVTRESLGGTVSYAGSLGSPTKPLDSPKDENSETPLSPQLDQTLVRQCSEFMLHGVVCIVSCSFLADVWRGCCSLADKDLVVFGLLAWCACNPVDQLATRINQVGTPGQDATGYEYVQCPGTAPPANISHRRPDRLVWTIDDRLSLFLVHDYNWPQVLGRPMSGHRCAPFRC